MQRFLARYYLGFTSSNGDTVKRTIKVRLDQASVSMLSQLCGEASDTVLNENNGFTLEWSCNLFSSDSIVLNENRIARIIVVSLTEKIAMIKPYGFLVKPFDDWLYLEKKFATS